MFSLGFKYGKECEENNILNSFLKLCEIKNTNLTINEATIAIEKEEKLIINEKNRLISLFNKDGKEKIYCSAAADCSSRCSRGDWRGHAVCPGNSTDRHYV